MQQDYVACLKLSSLSEMYASVIHHHIPSDKANHSASSCCSTSSGVELSKRGPKHRCISLDCNPESSLGLTDLTPLDVGREAPQDTVVNSVALNVDT